MASTKPRNRRNRALPTGLDSKIIADAIAALQTLAEQEAPRTGRESPYTALLDHLKPVILAARAKKHSWKRIADSLHSVGLDITRETIRRHIGPQKRSSTNSTIAQTAANKTGGSPDTVDTPAPATEQPERPANKATHQGATRRLNL